MPFRSIEHPNGELLFKNENELLSTTPIPYPDLIEIFDAISGAQIADGQPSLAVYLQDTHVQFGAEKLAVTLPPPRFTRALVAFYNRAGLA